MPPMSESRNSKAAPSHCAHSTKSFRSYRREPLRGALLAEQHHRGGFRVAPLSRENQARRRCSAPVCHRHVRVDDVSAPWVVMDRGLPFQLSVIISIHWRCWQRVRCDHSESGSAAPLSSVIAWSRQCTRERDTTAGSVLLEVNCTRNMFTRVSGICSVSLSICGSCLFTPDLRVAVSWMCCRIAAWASSGVGVLKLCTCSSHPLPTVDSQLEGSGVSESTARLKADGNFAVPSSGRMQRPMAAAR